MARAMSAKVMGAKKVGPARRASRKETNGAAAGSAGAGNQNSLARVDPRGRVPDSAFGSPSSSPVQDTTLSR